ncbi:MAG: sigma-70 family RNA polymerase sigma factor [Anaerolineae bacterium]
MATLHAPAVAHLSRAAVLPIPSASTDLSLLTRLAEGDETALARLYDRHAAAVYATALSIVRQPTAAEDIVQETFLRAWRGAAAALPTLHDPVAWLMRIARNQALDALRRQAVRPQAVESEEAADLFEAAPDETPEPEAVLWLNVRRQAVRRALAALPGEQRRVLELAFYEEMTHQAIAAHLCLPLGTVKTRARLGMRKLATALAPEGIVAA